MKSLLLAASFVLVLTLPLAVQARFESTTEAQPSIGGAPRLSTTTSNLTTQDDTLGTSAEVAPSEETSAQAGGIMVILVGAAGLPEYGEAFSQSAEDMMRVAQQAGFDWVCIGRREEPTFSSQTREQRYYELTADETLPSNDAQRLARIISQLDPQANGSVWLVMFGHGTFDGRHARFNLRGPDITAKELATELDSVQQPTVIVDCSSSSAPFVNVLSRTGRIVITSTRDGAEQNYSRFGKYFASTFLTLEADIDKDNQVSLLEAFLAASNHVAEFYESEKRLATEHALIDDNGDQRGTPCDWFIGVRVARESQSGGEPDGRRAHQIHLIPSPREANMTSARRVQRESLEAQIDQLRRRRDELAEAEYLQQLDLIAAQLAEVYEIKPPPADEPKALVLPEIKLPEQDVSPPRPTDDSTTSAVND